VSLTNRHLL